MAFLGIRQDYPTSTDVCVDARSDPGLAHDLASFCSRGKNAAALQAIFYPTALVLGGLSTYPPVTSGNATSPAPRVQRLPHIGPSTSGLVVTGMF